MKGPILILSIDDGASCGAIPANAGVRELVDRVSRARRALASLAVLADPGLD